MYGSLTHIHTPKLQFYTMCKIKITFFFYLFGKPSRNEWLMSYFNELEANCVIYPQLHDKQLICLVLTNNLICVHVM